MKILSSKQVHQADAFTIESEPINSIDLMERASKSFVDVFGNYYPITLKVVAICGTGNNGGDGLAVSRLLAAKGYNVQVVIVQPNSKCTPGFARNLSRIKDIPVQKIDRINDLPELSDFDIAIDAIFGSGLSRPVSGIYAEVIQKINESTVEAIAIDIPSGLQMDNVSSLGTIIKAKRTVSFQLPKLAFFFPENHGHVGEWEVVDIGLNEEFIEKQETKHFTLEKNQIKSILPPREKFDHKGSFGHAELIGGSIGKMGAMILATEAVLRSGAGLVSVNIPKCGQGIMQSTIPEAMLIEQVGDDKIVQFNFLDKVNVVGIGPGLGMSKETILGFGEFLRVNEKNLVIDADAINILAKHSEYLEILPRNTVLTPHLKEFDRLAGASENNWQRLDKAVDLCTRFNIIIILKGAHTAVIEPNGHISFNITGNSGMATAGSGDVLLGIITGLIAQGITSTDSAKVGVFIHGLAGDHAASELGGRSMIASDIIKNLGAAFLDIEQ